MRKILTSHVLLFLVLFVVIGFFVRVFNLTDVPLYGDELTIVLDSQSLLHTGKDQTGQSFPLTFSMGAGRPAGYVYGSIPFVAFFGANEWGVRGLSIFSGLVSIILIYFLGRRLFGSTVGLVAAFLYTFSFWDINLSRGGFEAHFALMLTLAGVVAALYAKQRQWLFIISAICFGLTLHTYPTYKVVLPLFLAGLGSYLLFAEKGLIKFKSPYLIIAVLLFLFISFVAVMQTFTSGSENRFLTINVFSDSQIQEQLTQKINAERTASLLSEPLKSFLHNRPLENLKLVSQNYLDNLSWDFLFMYGDKNPRHNMATMGYFYLVEILTLAFGFGYLIVKKQWKVFSFLLMWVLVSPLATSLITDPHGLRSAFLLPVLVLVSALGFISLWELRFKGAFILKGLVVLGFITQFIYYGGKLYFLAPHLYADFWAYEGKVATEAAMQNKVAYKYVVVSDRIDSIEYAYPVYAGVDPQLVIKQHPKSEQLFGSRFGFKKFDNVYIGNVVFEDLASQESVVYIGPIEDKEKMGNHITIKDKNNKDILVVGEVAQ